MRYVYVTTCMAVILSGCCTQPARNVPLSEAISGLRHELVKIKQECVAGPAASSMASPQLCNNSMSLSEMTIALAVADADTKSFSVNVPLGVSTLGGASTHSASTTNTVTLKFSNPVFASKDSMIAQLCTDKIGKLDKTCIQNWVSNTPQSVPTGPLTPDN